MLLVQKYLKTHSLDDLELEHGVNYHVEGHKVSLNYDQIAAKNSDPLACECRGLVLHKDTFDIIAFPFRRFFNLGQENASTIDWESAQVEEKMDGTMLCIHFDPTLNSWRVATRSRSEANVSLNGTDFTFTSLANYVSKNLYGKDIQQLMEPASRTHTYVFELCSLFNQVVCTYPELKFVLLAVRNNLTLQEEDPKLHALILGVPTVVTYPFTNLEEMVSLVESRNPKEYEGFVVKDRHFNRLKIKNKAYGFLNKGRDTILKSPKGTLEIILNKQEDDLLGLLPKDLGDNLILFRETLGQLFHQVKLDYLELKDIDNMKDFALLAQTKVWSTPLFQFKRGKFKTLEDYIASHRLINGDFPSHWLGIMLELMGKINPAIGHLLKGATPNTYEL